MSGYLTCFNYNAYRDLTFSSECIYLCMYKIIAKSVPVWGTLSIKMVSTHWIRLARLF